MSDSQPTWIGKTLGGRYQISSMLGRGGMSSVYKATDPNLQRTVAIKIIHPHLTDNPEFVKRFEQEAAAVFCKCTISAMTALPISSSLNISLANR